MKDDEDYGLKALQSKNTRKENLLYKQIYKFLENAEKAGYQETDLYTDKNKKEINITFGNYKNVKDHYRINISNITYAEKASENEHITDKKIKSNIKLEKLLGYNDGEYTDTKIIYEEKGLSKKPREYLKTFDEIYNSNKDEKLPKLRRYDLTKIALYSFAVVYGATEHLMVEFGLSYLDGATLASGAHAASGLASNLASNLNALNTAKEGLAHLGVLVAPFIPLQLSKKTRSLLSLLSLTLVAWTTNSLAYYPIGMITGYTKNNLSDLLNWYKFQFGFGKESYTDVYGPLSIKVTSFLKGLSYPGRLGIAAALPKLKNLTKRAHKGKGIKTGTRTEKYNPKYDGKNRQNNRLYDIQNQP